jgi:outer membrane protein TolC
LLSDVATNYVQMRTLQKRIEYTHLNVANQRKTMEKAESRRNLDNNGDLALNQALALLKQTEASVSELEISLRQTTDRLCVLLGIPPEELQRRLEPPQSVNVVLGIPAGLLIEIPAATEELAVGIPADLLRRRPDVRRAERQAAAQSALIGVAESDFYPHISLLGTLGWSAESFKNVFRSSAFNGTIGPSVQWDILLYGRILNNVRFQDARFRELVAAFQNQVLIAQQEVEDGRIVYQKAQDRTKLQVESVTAAQKAESIALSVYELKGVDFTTLSLIQQNLVQQQDTLAQAQGEIALGLIQIYKAGGGGWQPNGNGNGDWIAHCAPSAVHLVHRRRVPVEDAAPALHPTAVLGAPSDFSLLPAP